MDLEGSDCDLIEVLFQHLPGGTKENHRKPWSGWPVPWPEFRQLGHPVQCVVMLIGLRDVHGSDTRERVIYLVRICGVTYCI
jgi:hypothetical protein